MLHPVLGRASSYVVCVHELQGRAGVAYRYRLYRADLSLSPGPVDTVDAQRFYFVLFRLPSVGDARRSGRARCVRAGAGVACASVCGVRAA